MKVSPFCIILVLLGLSLGLLFTACSSPAGKNQASETANAVDCQSPPFPHLQYDPANLFPTDGSLLRPEDGKVLPDGRLVVAHQADGLHIVSEDGTHHPFGKFKEAEYVHNPPAAPGGANGVFLEADNKHLLVCDCFSGKIFRVDIETEATELIYDHPFGVNNLYRDKTGAIWFSQTTNNREEDGPMALFMCLNTPIPTGAVYRLGGSGDAFDKEARLMIDSLYLANGISLDRSEQHLYLSETMMDRVLRYDVDVAAGTVSGREVYQAVYTPDNLSVDADDNLWVASPLFNQVVVVDPVCKSLHTVFSAPSDKNARLANAWIERSHLGQGLLELLGPDAWYPLPGTLTGMCWSADRKTIYILGLGNAAVKCHI